MKRIPTYLKMRVLGALEYAEGASMKTRYEAVAAMTFKDEDGDHHQFTWRTIQTWWYWYRHHGMVESPARSDKGTTRKVHPEALLEAIERVLPTFRKNPNNLQAIYRACIEAGHLRRDQVAPNTFRRHVKRLELLKEAGALLEGPAKKARLAFAKAHANEMWQSDTLHGPYLTIEGKAMKTYLICFIDDASRVIPHGEFYLADSTPRLIDCFQSALFKRGVPRSIYVDNGSNYSSKEFSLICARLGIQLIHTPVRDGAAKGKIERFFRTVRDQFLVRNLADIRTLKQLNARFLDWVEDIYHQREHSTLGMKPLDRLGLDLSRQRFLTPSPFNKELFYLEESRNVRADNTFNLKGRRYEAPRDLRHRKIEVRFDRNDAGVPPIVYAAGERMGEATLLDFQSNDRGRKFED
ncbi:MAG TPA: DDE-type integrase/transposase/recombinase [Verrucomicrobiales bacterium]|nr:DDE-type integrase/transposase/recombinase [Verrucomicrobiales bacterium]